MELTNEFRVAVPLEEAWAVLTDVERIAPCLPGAQLQEIEGDQYRGIVKVKVGPITAQYKGVATFLEQDVAAHRVVLKAEGRDTRGQGNANATVTATLSADGDATAVKVVTDLTITGKVAQFGRGVLAEVSGKLMGQFVDNLHRDVLSGGTAATTPAASTAPALATDAPATEAAATAAKPASATTGASPAASAPAASSSAASSPAASSSGATSSGPSSSGASSSGASSPAATSAPASSSAASSPAATSAAASSSGSTPAGSKSASASAPAASASAGATGSSTSAPTPGSASRGTGGPNGSEPPAGDSAAATTVRRVDSPDPEPVDLMATAGSSVARRLGPLLGALVASVVLWRLVMRRRRR